MRVCRWIIYWGLLMPSLVRAQNYRAIHGSSWAGALGAANNPSSIVHVPFKWDLTLFSVQETHSTNAFYVEDFSLLSHAKNIKVKGQNGTGKGLVFANQDIHLFNGRVRLNEEQAIAFGVNIRSYVEAKTSRVTYSDTADDLRQIMNVNRDHVPLQGNLQGTAWAEIFGTYARTIFDNERRVLNAGLTVSITRGLAGGYLRAGNIGFEATADPGKYVLSDATLEYGYSINIDDADEAEKNKRSAFTRRTLSSVSLSAGLEYIIPVEKDGDESNGYQYDLKIGVSVLDLGFNNYRYSANSRAFVLDGANIADSALESKFDNVSSIEDINDTIASLSSSVSSFNGFFRVFQPARIVVNIDKNIMGDLFVNGELTLPLTPLLGKRNLLIREMNLLAITPRIENRLWGVYLPFTMNTRGQAWVGGALKAGPVLFGLHNWANVFAKNKIQKGGFYLALTFRPGKKRDHTAREKRIKLSKQHRQQLNCPSF